MATTAAAGVSISTPRVVAKAAETPKVFQSSRTNNPWKRPSVRASAASQLLAGSGRRSMVRPVHAAPDKLSDKVADSIKSAQEACSDDPASGECVAAWDEVEELSAAASHARDNKKGSDDPLETYCKDNPETDECRTYDN